jgi:hypothetical protein
VATPPEDVLREKIFDLIFKDGPMGVDEIADYFDKDTFLIRSTLNHSWFEQDTEGRWGIALKKSLKYSVGT